MRIMILPTSLDRLVRDVQCQRKHFASGLCPPISRDRRAQQIAVAEAVTREAHRMQVAGRVPTVPRDYAQWVTADPQHQDDTPTPRAA